MRREEGEGCAHITVLSVQGGLHIVLLQGCSEEGVGLYAETTKWEYVREKIARRCGAIRNESKDLSD